MSETYYFEKASATPEIISDWDNYEEDSWEDVQYIKFFGTDYFLFPSRGGHTLSFSVDLDEPFEIFCTYKPLWTDPGDHIDDEFRYDWMQTDYAPQIEFKGTFVAERNCSLICSNFLDSGKDYIDPPDNTDDVFPGQFDDADFAHLAGKAVRIHLNVSNDPASKMFLEDEDPAIFISLPQSSMLRLLDQLESGEYESLGISAEVPGFRIKKSPFSRFDSTWRDEGNVFLIPELRSFREETSTYMRLVKRARTDDHEIAVSHSEQPSKSVAIPIESKAFKVSVIVVLMILALYVLA